MIPDEFIALRQGAVLCWLATVDASGQPSVSPKEMFEILDREHVLIADISSPHSLANIAQNSQVCVAFVDIFLQKGCQLYGRAEIIRPADSRFEPLARPLAERLNGRFTIRSLILVTVTASKRILAPSYQFHPAETSEQTQIADALRTYRVREHLRGMEGEG